MRLHWPASSLRGKLILACVLVQLAAAALLVLGSMRLLQSSMSTPLMMSETTLDH